jgi:hypothetical protein
MPPIQAAPAQHRMRSRIVDPDAYANAGIGSVSNMKPFFLAQFAQEFADQFQLTMLCSPLNMLGQAKHLEHRGRVVPGG